MNRKSRSPFFITKNAAFNFVPFVDSHHLQTICNTTKTAKRKRTAIFLAVRFLILKYWKV